MPPPTEGGLPRAFGTPPSGGSTVRPADATYVCLRSTSSGRDYAADRRVDCVGRILDQASPRCRVGMISRQVLLAQLLRDPAPTEQGYPREDRIRGRFVVRNLSALPHKCCVPAHSERRIYAAAGRRRVIDRCCHPIRYTTCSPLNRRSSFFESASRADTQ